MERLVFMGYYWLDCILAVLTCSKKAIFSYLFYRAKSPSLIRTTKLTARAYLLTIFAIVVKLYNTALIRYFTYLQILFKIHVMG
jgi:hypothetical protein